MFKIRLFALVILAICRVEEIQGLLFSLSDEDLQFLEQNQNAFINKNFIDNLYEEVDENNEISESGNIFAVLVAGSRGYGNYRHQADVCHAYQILRRNGVPDENIVVMMFDDIANSSSNPTPGIIINRPNGTDVYEGVLKDYTHTDVNPETFTKVLLGDEQGLAGTGSGKVLKSGPNDYVLINFVDHGAPGLVAFPNAELYASELRNTLKKMHQMKKFKKLVFYLEACESGSMFQNLLPTHWNIFATTAANSKESSYACYFDEKRETYLGDLYSVNWMENADQVDSTQETLQDQFVLIKKETNLSHVQEFGDNSLRSLKISAFIGNSKEILKYEPIERDAVESGEVHRIILEKKIMKADNLEERKEHERNLFYLHKMRNAVDILFKKILNGLTLTKSKEEKNLIISKKLTLKNIMCYETVAKFFSKHCLSIAKNTYVTRKLYIFVNLCERSWTSDTIIKSISENCQKSIFQTENGIV